MWVRVRPDGLCYVAGDRRKGAKLPAVAWARTSADGRPYAQCYWDDLPAVRACFEGGLSIDDESKANYKAKVEEAHQLAAALSPAGAEPPTIHTADKYRPRQYQAAAAVALVRAKRVLLADSVGLGKTLASFCARQLLKAAHKELRTVVLCPCSIKWQWAGELRAYSGKTVKPIIVDGPSAKRGRLYESYKRSRAGVLIMNYELLRHDEPWLEAVFAATRLVVADEASRFKTRSTKTARLLKALTADVQYKLALTATPLETSCENLYSIMEWVDPSVFCQAQMFNRLYLVTRDLKLRTGRVVRKVVGYRNLDHMRRRVGRRCLRRRPEDVGEQLPAVVAQIRWVDLPKAQRAAYERAKEGCRDKLRGNPAQPMVAVLDAVRACLSQRLVGGKGTGVKTADVVDLLTTEAAGERALVFTASRRYIEGELLPSLKKEGVDCAAIVGDMGAEAREARRSLFVAGGLRVLVLDAAGEYGLNLPCGLVVNLDLPWNPAKLAQRVGRARRMDSREARVRVVNVLARGTVEERALARVYKRRDLADVIVGAADMDPVGKLTADDVGEML
jgi:SNF2 family DNA or RNA helicase